MGERTSSAKRASEWPLVALVVVALLFAGPGPGDLALAAAALLATWREGLPGTRSALLLLFVGLLAASQLSAADAWAGTLALAQWTRIGLGLLVGASLPWGEGVERARRLAIAAGVAAFLLCLHGAWQVFVLQPGLSADPSGLEQRVAMKLAEGRAHSIFLLPGHYGALAAALVVLLAALSLGAVLARQARERSLLLLGCGAALGAVALSRSLSAAVILAFGLGLLALTALRGRARLVLLGAGLGAALLVAAGAALTRDDLASDNPVAARALNWQAAERLVRERPVLGWGGGAFAHEYARVRPLGANETRHAHHFALERAAEHGLLVLPLLAAFVAGLARSCLRAIASEDGPSQRLLAAAPACAAAVLLAHGFLDFGWSQASWAVPAALLVGLAARNWWSEREASPPSVGRAVVALLGLALVAVGVVDREERRRHEAVRAAALAGDHVSATQLAGQARRLSPFSSRAWAMEAEAVLASAGGDPELAALALRLADEAARLSPRRASLHGLRARALAAAGRPLEAWFAAERAAALAPTVENWSRLANLLRPVEESAP